MSNKWPGDYGPVELTIEQIMAKLQELRQIEIEEGCRFCYAVTMTKRLAAMGQQKYTGLVNDGKGHFNGVVALHEDALTIPLKWRKPRRVFVNSMSDLFHKEVPFEFIDKVFAVMALCYQHTFQILTKRPERMAEYLTGYHDRNHVEARDLLESLGYPRKVYAQWPLPNVWLGTSVEDQATADERIPRLIECEAAVRFLSCEPLLGPVDLAATCSNWTDSYGRMPGIDWVIVGGESGPGARPMHPDWARSLRDQCARAAVPFFFKQWGGVDKRGAGRVLDARTWDEFPEVRR